MCLRTSACSSGLPASVAPQVCAEEARESYATEIVHEVQSNSTEDLESNVARAVAWVQAWRADRK